MSNLPPSPFVAANGVGSVTDAQLNTYVQGAMIAADLRFFVGVSNMTTALVGINSPDDGGQGLFYYNATSTAADDNLNIIAPFGQTAGRWLRLLGGGGTAGSGGYYAVDTGVTNAITVALTPTPVSLAALVGVPIRVLVRAINTGATTITVTGIVVNAPVHFPGGFPLPFAALQTNGIATFVYDGTQFELQSVAIGMPAMVIEDYFDMPAAQTAIVIPTPIGEGPPVQINTAASIAVPTAITNSDTIVETGLAIQFTSSTGKGASVPASANRVGLFVAVDATTNSGNVWAINPLVVIETGACTLGGVQTAEFDLANLSGTDYGNTLFAAGLVQPAAWGMQITGAGTNKATGAIIIEGTHTGGGHFWNRGIAFTECIEQSEIEGYANCTQGYLIAGTKVSGIDTTGGSFSIAPVLIGNASYIEAANAAGSGHYHLIGANASDAVEVGGAAVTNIETNTAGGFRPAVDNAQPLGGLSNRWTAVYAVNGTIQTSDPTLKTAIEPLPSCLSLMQTITPIRFRWREEGREKTPGTTVHWGFNATDIKAAMDGAGHEFGGYVKEDYGPESLRPDQLIAVLWKAVQELSAEVAALKERP